MNPVLLAKTAVKAGVTFGAAALKFASKHAPVILAVTGTGLMVGGSVAAYQSGKEVQAIKETDEFASEYVAINNRPGNHTFENAMFHLRTLGRHYFTPVVLIGAGLLCFHGGLFVQSRRMATMAAALATAEGLVSSYSDEIANLVTEGTKTQVKAGEKVDSGLAERYGDVPDDVVVGIGDTVFVDGMTGLTFRSTESDLRAAEAWVLETVADGESVSIDEFYSYLRIEHPGKITRSLGWRGGVGEKRPQLTFSSVYLGDGRSRTVIHYNAVPLPDGSENWKGLW